MQQITLKVVNEVGLHARPAAAFVKQAGQFVSKIQMQNVTNNSPWADAKSILSVLMLGVEKDHEIELLIEGSDEQNALQALRTLIETDFAGNL